MYGTGNQIYGPPNFVQTSEHLDSLPPGPPTIKLADFTRVTTHRAPGYLAGSADHSTLSIPIEPKQQPPPAQVNGHNDHSTSSQQRSQPRSNAPQSNAPQFNAPQFNAPQFNPPQFNPPSQPPPPIPSNSEAGPSLSARNSISAARINRQSIPLPDVPLGGGSRGNESSQTPPPIPQQPSGNTILFYGQLMNFFF